MVGLGLIGFVDALVIALVIAWQEATTEMNLSHRLQLFWCARRNRNRDGIMRTGWTKNAFVRSAGVSFACG